MLCFRSMVSRFCTAVALAALAIAPLGACTGGTILRPGGLGTVAATAQTGPGRKQVVAKRPPELLVAADGSGCDVSPDVFRDTKVGDVFDCPDWRAEPVKEQEP